MYAFDHDQRFDNYLDWLARNEPRYAAGILERIRLDLPPARLLLVQADLPEVVERVLPAVFAAVRSGESLDDDATLLVHRAAEACGSARVPLTTVLGITSIAATAAVEVTRDLSAVSEGHLTTEVVARGLPVLQEVLVAAAAGHGRGTTRSGREPPGPLAATRIPLGGTAREVLRLVADGRTNAEIAAELRLSTQTVNYHVRRLMQLVGAANRTAVVTRAFRRGWLA